jgi:hypothetical protein
MILMIITLTTATTTMGNDDNDDDDDDADPLAFFYGLVVSGTAQFGLQCAGGVLFLLDAAAPAPAGASASASGGGGWFTASMRGHVEESALGLVGYRTLMGLHTFAAGVLLLAFLCVAGFHTYLLCSGLGTYDWLLRRCGRASGGGKERRGVAGGGGGRVRERESGERGGVGGAGGGICDGV